MAKRLIDADALMGKLSRMIDYCNKDPKVNGLTALFQVGDAIMDCPTVEAVEVVRCKDCIHRVKGNWAKCTGRGPDDFCSDGVRRFHYPNCGERMDGERKEK